jgi:hypothetical protein
MSEGIEARTVRAKEFLRHLNGFLKGDNHEERGTHERGSEVELVFHRAYDESKQSYGRDI